MYYHGYEIAPGPCYTRDSQWQYTHEDYDGPEDSRIGLAASVEECKSEIDCQIEDILFSALSAACGYMRNAQIDLETGAPKATAIRTIKGGLARAEAALAAAARQGGDVQQAPAESPQSGPKGNAQTPSEGS